MYSFGQQPVTNRFLSNATKNAPFYPIQLSQDKLSGLIYLINPFPVEEIRARYDWITCFEPEDHLDELVSKIINLPNINKNSIFGGYSFKDDSTLDRLRYLGYSKQWRIDPILDLHADEPNSGVETFQRKFTQERVLKIAQKYGKADVIVIRHVLEHSYDLKNFIESAFILVKPGGYIVWEIPDCERSLRVGDCTMLWEEHTYYFTRSSFRRTLDVHQSEILDLYSIEYPLESSLIAIVKKKLNKKILLNTPMKNEADLLEDYVQILLNRKNILQSILREIKKKTGRGICIFGAGHLTTTFISIMEIQDFVEFIVDDNQNKKGMFLPVGGIEIKGSEHIYDSGIKFCFLGMNPHNHPQVIMNNQKFIESGGIFGSIFPGTRGYVEDLVL